MIARQATPAPAALARGFPVVAPTGPRHSGKTTLARLAFPHLPYLSLELPQEKVWAAEDPVGFLDRFPDGAVLDEIQYCPGLFSRLQVRVDAARRMGHHVISGSQQFGLNERISQSLAGRVGLETWLSRGCQISFARHFAAAAASPCFSHSLTSSRTADWVLPALAPSAASSCS